jgi:hypothetical protein
MKHRRVKPPSTLADRMKKEARDLRKQAQGMPPRIRREVLLSKASRADAASHVDTHNSPVLESPK